MLFYDYFQSYDPRLLSTLYIKDTSVYIRRAHIRHVKTKFGKEKRHWPPAAPYEPWNARSYISLYEGYFAIDKIIYVLIIITVFITKIKYNAMSLSKLNLGQLPFAIMIFSMHLFWRVISCHVVADNYWDLHLFGDNNLEILNS
jgi:hypothetical protein